MSERIIRKYNKPKGSGEGTNYVNYNITIGSGGQNNYKYLNADQAKIGDLNADNITAMNIKTIYLMADNGTISKISGNELDYGTGHFGELSTDNFHADKMDADYADIKHLVNEYMNSQHIDVKDLTVTGTAHFFQLIIDKINSVEGTQIISAAHCDIDYVEPIDSNGDIVTDENETPVAYKVYWKKSQDGKAIQNSWVVNDQAIAMNFNEAQVGTNTNVSNTNYWRLVKDVCPNNERVWVNYNTGDKLYEQPDDKIKFNGFSWTRGAITDPETGETLDGDSNELWTVEGQANGIWDPAEVGEPGSEHVDTSGAGTMTANQTLLGIQIGVDNNNNPNDSDPKFVKYGTFSFTTYKSNDDAQVEDEPLNTKLNVGFYYDDDFVEYFPANEYKSEYSFELQHDADVEQIVISSAVVDEFNESWWITLGNETAGTGKNEEDYMTNSTVPKVGDTIAQLGYRPSRENDSNAKRNCAIIIAAYETPDKGLLDPERPNEWIKSQIEPPSYAQYMDITTFELARYRKTYMDATGAYIMGKLVSESGQEIDIDDGLTVDTEYYQIISNENPIIKPASGQTTEVQFTVLHVKNGVGNVLAAADLTNFNMKVNNGAISRSSGNNYFTYTVTSNSDSQLDITLYEGSTLKDEILLSVVDLGTVTDGKDGTEYELKYKNAQTKPADNEDRTTANNWYDTATTPDFVNGYYTWMSQRNTYYDNLGNKVWTSWTSAIRITGDNGQRGEDGTPGAPGANGTDGSFTEFIFAVNNDIDNAPNIIYTYDGTSQYIVTDSNDNILRWYDQEAQTWRQRITAGGAYAPDYIPPSQLISTSLMGTVWKDDPIGPDATNKYEWVSTRKYDGLTRTFTDFTTPVIWAIYAEDGQSGQDGQNGQDGDDGDNGQEDTINLLRGIFDVRINANNYDTVVKYENITGALYTDIIVAVKHTDGTNSTYITDLSDYSLALATDNTAGNNTFTSSTVVNITTDGDDSSTTSTYKALRFNYSNLLTQINTSAISGHTLANLRNYYYLHKNGLTTRMPTKIFVKLMKGTDIIDTTSIDLEFKADHIFSVGETQLNSIYQGLTGKTGVSWTTGFSQIHQDWQNINLSVNNIKKASTLQYPEDNETQEYVWMVDVKTNTPSTPTTISYTTPALHGYWTTSSGTTYLDSTYNGHFMSNRTRDSYFGNDGTLQYTSWTSWSTPTLYATYENGIGTSVNSAQLDITAEKISTTVYNTNSKGYQTTSQVTQTANQIATSVYNTNANGYQTLSQVTQTAESISASVQTNIEGKLYDTGIDIQGNNRTITLNADKVIFSNSVGTVTNKISIDPTTGTLNATDGNFSGVVNATTLYSSAYNIPSSTTSLTIGGSNQIYTQYLTQNPTSDINIYLPDPLQYDGLEIGFFVFVTNIDIDEESDITNMKSIIINRTNSSAAYLRAKKQSFMPAVFNSSSSSNNYVYNGWKRNQATPNSFTQVFLETIISPMTGKTYVKIAPNTLTKFKSIGGRWYQIEGNNIGGSSDYTPN